MRGSLLLQLNSCMLHLLGSPRSTETVCSILTNTMNLLSPRINTDCAPPQSRYAWKPRVPRLWNVRRNSRLYSNHIMCLIRYVLMHVCVGCGILLVWIKNRFGPPLREDEMNHSCFNIPSGNLSSLPHTVFNSETVKEHLALDREHHSVSH